MGFLSRIKKKVTDVTSKVGEAISGTATKAVSTVKDVVSKVGKTISKAKEFVTPTTPGGTSPLGETGVGRFLGETPTPSDALLAAFPAVGIGTKVGGKIGTKVGKKLGSKAGKELSPAVLSKIKNIEDAKIAQDFLKGINVGDGAFVTFGKTVLAGLKKNPVKWVAGITLGGVYTAKEFLWDPGVLASWAAVDNVAGLVSFTSKNINEATKERAITKAEGEEFYTDAFGKIDNSESWIKLQMKINPLLLFGAGKQMLAAIDVARVQVQTNKIIFDEIDPEAETFIERQDRRDTEFQAAQEEKENKQIERDEKIADAVQQSKIDDQEKTLFFEALRIRNAGEKLTEEQKAILRKFGIDPDLAINIGRSQLSFGLLG